MLLSICTPVMNRAGDLKKVMSDRIDAAARSLPVEFVVLDYNSQDDLQDFVTGELLRHCDATGIRLTYRKFGGREHYHQAHAYNLAALSAHGEYICIMGADTYPKPTYFETIRKMIAEGYAWMEDRRYKGAICVKRDDFISIGGYDERFEFYGPEDRDLAVRLTRHGGKKGVISGLIGNIPTPDDVKVANYRVRADKNQLSKMMRPIFEENRTNNVVRVNLEGWGQW